MELNQAIKQAKPLDARRVMQAQEKWNSVAKPPHSLGLLEEAVVRLEGISGADIGKRCVLVLCADNGVTAQSVTQTGSGVTPAMARAIFGGTSSVARMAQAAGADVLTVDVGMFQDIPGMRTIKQASGTKDLSKGPAMTREQAVATIETGIALVKECRDAGYGIIATGEMGIGNTTTSSAIASVLLGKDPAQVTGRGAGLSDERLRHKTQVIQSAIALHKPDPSDPIDVLSKLGGYDIAAMVGVYLGGAAYRMPIVIDGLISSVAALLAARLCPVAAQYMLASHVSQEPAAGMVLDALGMRAMIHAGMCLGEGTGAVALLPLLDLALNVYRTALTFEDLAIEVYEPQ